MGARNMYMYIWVVSIYIFLSVFLSLFLYVSLYLWFSLFICVYSCKCYLARVVLCTQTCTVHFPTFYATKDIYRKAKANRPQLACKDRHGYTKGSHGQKAKAYQPQFWSMYAAAPAGCSSSPQQYCGNTHKISYESRDPCVHTHKIFMCVFRKHVMHGHFSQRGDRHVHPPRRQHAHHGVWWPCGHKCSPCSWMHLSLGFDWGG